MKRSKVTDYAALNQNGFMYSVDHYAMFDRNVLHRAWQCIKLLK